MRGGPPLWNREVIICPTVSGPIYEPAAETVRSDFTQQRVPENWTTSVWKWKWKSTEAEKSQDTVWRHQLKLHLRLDCSEKQTFVQSKPQPLTDASRLWICERVCRWCCGVVWGERCFSEQHDLESHSCFLRIIWKWRDCKGRTTKKQTFLEFKWLFYQRWIREEAFLCCCCCCFFFSITAYSPGSVPTTDPHGAGTLLVPKAVDQISDNDSLNMHEELQYLHHCTGSEHKSKWKTDWC